MFHLVSKRSIGRWLAALAGAAGLAATAAQAGSLSVLYSFTGGIDGATPYKGVAAGAAGSFYGEAFYGANACPDSLTYANVGCGTLYSVKPGSFTTLTTFLGATNGADGFATPTVSGKTIYGSAYVGGTSNLGLVFSTQINGKQFKILHQFSGTDGANPNTYLRLDGSGDIYSVAATGGPGYDPNTAGSGFGVLFELTPDGTYIPQHDFSGGTDGGAPGRLFLDASGTIYGSAGIGGSCSGSGAPTNGCGVIYSFVPNTGVYTVLYTFTGGNDGYKPQLGGLDKAADLYGVASGGADGEGTLFELKNTAKGFRFSTIWTFTGGSDGAIPTSPPVVAANGTLTGTTLEGPITQSSTGEGTLYTFAKGQLTTLYTFVNDANGGYPQGTPIVSKSGVITGTTNYGGVAPCNTTDGTLISSYGCGIIYQYTP